MTKVPAGRGLMTRRTALLALMGALPAACAIEPGRARFPEITFAHRPAFRLDVAAIEVVEAYRPSTSAPHVETELPMPPDAMLRAWARDRLQAVGRAGRARFVILDASVIQVPLAVAGGIADALTVDQAYRYDASVKVRIDLADGAGLRTARVEASARESRSVAEDITLNDRERVWFAMTEALASTLDAELDRAVPRHLRAFLR